MRLDKLVIKGQLVDVDRVDRMVDSFQAYGQLEPVVVRDRTVIDGVVRCLAAQALGWEEIEVQKL